MRKFLVFLFSLFILASCQTTSVETYDWCYIYDFTTDDYGFNFDAGAQIDDLGIISGAGVIQVSYDHGQFVAPNSVLVTVARPDGIEGDIDIQAAGIIYGVEIVTVTYEPLQSQPTVVSPGIFVTMSTDQETVALRPLNTGDAGTVVNVTIDVGAQELLVTRLEIRGLGATPFDENPCEQGTPTPTLTIPAATSTEDAEETWTPTNTPTETPTPTDTPEDTPIPTNTLNPDPSPTPVPPCAVNKCLFDHFEYSDAEIAAQQWGYTRTTVAGQVEYSSAIPEGPAGSIDGGEFALRTCQGSNCNALFIADYYLNDFYSVIGVAGFAGRSDEYGVYDGDYIVRVQFDDGGGLGANCDVVNEDDNTGWNFFDESTTGCENAGSTNRIRVSVGATRGVHVTTGDQAWSFVDELRIEFDDPIVPPASHTPFPMTATATRTPFATSVGGVATRTPIAFTPQPTVDLTQETATPANTLPATPTYITSTYVPSVTAFASAVAGEGTPTPSVEEIRENEAEYEILDEMQNNQNWLENTVGGLFDFLGGAFGWFFQSIADLFSMIYDFFNWIFGLIAAMFAVFLEIVQIILMAINLIFGLLGLLLMYVQQLIARLTALIGAFFTAPPTPIPGLPLCISDPFSHDLCAIYYIADWTLFKPNSPGQFIIPILLTMMNIIIIFRAGKYVLKFIKRGEDVTR